MKLTGKRSKEWNKLKDKLKDYYGENPYCRLKSYKCKTYAEGFAHSLKRRNMGKWGSKERENNLLRAVPLCNTCHEILEFMGEEIMEQEIERLILIEENKHKEI
jgi:hypothetical protein